MDRLLQGQVCFRRHDLSHSSHYQQPIQRSTPFSYLQTFPSPTQNLSFKMYRRTSPPQRLLSYNADSTPTLHSLSLFLPANELTFLIGSSGSGKSTVAQLLLGFQSPQPGNGHVTIDEQDLRFLDDAWIRENIMFIGQGIGASL